MLFQIIHTHDLEHCSASSPEQGKVAIEWWQSFKETPGVKVLSGYVAPLEHTYYITVETEDYSTLTKAVGTLLCMGTGRVIPVLSMDAGARLTKSGAFKKAK
jgi:hypothetical protein